MFTSVDSNRKNLSIFLMRMFNFLNPWIIRSLKKVKLALPIKSIIFFLKMMNTQNYN